MAKKASLGEAEAEPLAGASPEDLKRVLGEIARHKANATEYGTFASEATANAIERYGLDRTALTFARRLHEMEDAKRHAVILALLSYLAKLGHLDGGLFPDELIALLEPIVARHHNGPSYDDVPFRSEEDRAVDDALVN